MCRREQLGVDLKHSHCESCVCLAVPPQTVQHLRDVRGVEAEGNFHLLQFQAALHGRQQG